ncbi:MAG: signal peptidase I [Nitrospinae bacterium]|nr:signal peptidase I [Nitrospinota bacterium]
MIALEKIGAAAFEMFKGAIVALLLVVFLKGSMVEANQIVSGSMIPTLMEGDFIIVNKIKYGLHLPFVGKMVYVWSSPDRGDVVTFQPPAGSFDGIGKIFVKRIVAIPGDRVEIVDSRLYINGQPVETSRSLNHTGEYLESMGDKKYKVIKRDPHYFFGPVVVPEGYVFAVGDNRDNSLDSRSWGPLPIENIEGKAVFIYFSRAWDAGVSAIERIGSLL